jgi:membrane-associated phospholipid phosphatase
VTTRGTDQGGRTATWHAWPALAAAGGLFLLPLLLFVTLAEDVAEHEVFAFDRPVMMWLHGNASPGLTALMEGLTQLGGLVVVPVVATIAAVVLWRRGLRRGATVLAAAVIGSTLLNAALKAVFRRARPDFWEHLVTENSYSFPSGHAMASMAVAAAVVVLTWRTRWRWTAVAAGAAYVLAVGVSRMYLGVHFPSDILAGWSVSVAWVAVVVVVLRLVDALHRRGGAGRRTGGAS